MKKEDLIKYRGLLRQNINCVETILNEKSIGMAKDWAWAEFPFAKDNLKRFLNKDKHKIG